MSARESVTRVASSTGGQVLRAATGIMTIRPAAKPLHPRGSVVRAVLHRSGPGTGAGVAWLDEARDDEVLVRLSRAVGLPSGAPDIFGLAVRVPTDHGRHGDLLLASGGLGRLTRHLLVPSRTPYARPMTTLLPYRTAAGPVLLAAVFDDETTAELSWSVGTGPWRPFASLVLDQHPQEGADPLMSFDPVENGLPGLATYDWVRRLREPAYATARSSRGSRGPLPPPG